MLDHFGPDELVGVMTSFRQALSTHQKTINRLNVFPVPDGDTGTNMLATVESVMREIDAIGGSTSMASVAKAIGHGSLMGARGNSGVILCQILRGLADAASSKDTLAAAEIATGLRAGSDAANAAVLRPVGGTILTVAADAADAASHLVSSAPSLVALLEFTRAAAMASLFRTPQLLAILAEAGVVDAGGAGLLCLYDALLSMASGRPMPTTLELPEGVGERISHGVSHVELPGDPASSPADELRFEVMYLLEAPDETVDAFKELWRAIGDSIVVVGGDGLYNCHIHTNDIGAAIEAALDVGRPREIRVTDLNEQVEEERWVRQATSNDLGVSASTDVPLTSVVTVATGDGIRRVFRSLGVDSVVNGGQSMNPSTAEILQMIEDAPGGEVVVLPNNTNIYPVAAEASKLSAKPVFVVPTPGVPEGFAALLDFDPMASAQQNATTMTKAASIVVCGEVTRAVRATSTAVGEVAADDFIGLSRSGIESIGKNLADATIGLLQKLINGDHEIVTLIEGAGVDPSELRRVTEWMADCHPKVALERIQGDQPLYPFFISIE